MTHFLPMLLAGLFGTCAAAQSIVIPAPAALAPGDATNAFPWGTSASQWPGLRILTTYGEQNFRSGGVNEPIQITKLKWRRDDNGGPQTGGTFAAATIRCSTSPVGHGGVTTNFAGNHGADLTTVYQGPVTYAAHQGAPGWTPESWCVEVELQTPFVYDSTLGDLVIDVEYAGTAFSGGSLGGIDMQTANANASRVYASGSFPNANGVTYSYAPVVGLDYTLAGAWAWRSGVGCSASGNAQSFYEQFPTAASFDLSFRAIQMTGNQTGYTVTGDPAAMRPFAHATPLNLLDDSEVAVPLLSGWIPDGFYGRHTALTVCSNGYVSLGSNGSDYSIVPVTLLNAPFTGWYCKHDFLPSASRSVRWEETATHVHVTWDRVPTFGRAGSASTFQFQFEKGTRNVKLVFGAMDSAGPGFLVGFSPGGPSNDPGGRDLSAIPFGGFQLDGWRRALAADAPFRPVLGTSIPIRTGSIPYDATVGFTVLGLPDPAGGTPLAGFGMPGCFGYTTGIVSYMFLPDGEVGSVFLTLPANPLWSGTVLAAQSFVLSPSANALGLISSNAVRLRLGRL